MKKCLLKPLPSDAEMTIPNSALIMTETIVVSWPVSVARGVATFGKREKLEEDSLKGWGSLKALKVCKSFRCAILEKS